MVNPVKITKPTSRSRITTEGFLSINFAKTTARNVCSKMMVTAPAAKIKALVRPSSILTFAAVMLIKPGGVIPMAEVRNPKKIGMAKVIYFFILNLI